MTSSDSLMIFTSSSAESANWTYQGQQECAATGVQTLSVSFTLGDTVGDQVIRAAFVFNGNTTNDCDPGSYNDRDDVVLAVGKPDLDRDGLVDGYEDTLGTDYLDPDSDNDGMPDGWEHNNGTDPLVADAGADPDGDGLENFSEYFAGSDPLTPDTDSGGVDDKEELQRGHDPLHNLDDYSEVELQLGDTTNGWSSSSRCRGNMFSVSSATMLKSFSNLLNPSAGTTVYFEVYEGNSIDDEFKKIFEGTTVVSGGTGWYDSGPIDAVFTPGKSYSTMACWVSSGYFGGGHPDNPPIGTFFGTAYGSYINAVSFPPPARYNVNYSGSTFYTQKLDFCDQGCFPANAAVFRDTAGWSHREDQIMSDHGVPYDVYDNTGIGTVDLSSYDKVIVHSLQDEAFYAKLEANKKWLNEWVKNGGNFEFNGYATQGTWHHIHRIPTDITSPGFQFSGDVDLLEMYHPLTIGVLEAASVDSWGNGWFDGWGGDPTHLIAAGSANERPVHDVFDYGRGRTIASTYPLENLSLNDSEKALLDNAVLHERQYNEPCPSPYQAGSDASNSAASDRYRGNKYYVADDYVLEGFFMHLDPPAGTELDCRVYQSDSLSGTYNMVKSYAVSTGEGRRAWYGPDDTELELGGGKYYALVCGWSSPDSTRYYWQTGYSFPEDTPFGSVQSGTYASYPLDYSTGLGNSSNGYYQRVYARPKSLDCRVVDTDGDGMKDGIEVYEGTSVSNPDTDGDGMPDYWEVAYLQDPNTPDATNDDDSDGLTNQEEYAWGSNPNLADTDGDGLDDQTEVLVIYTHPARADTDGDGMNDFDEVNQDGNPDNYTAGVDCDPHNPDTDLDGIPDGWEYDNGLDPLDDVDPILDFDNDGMTNWQEYFYQTDPNLADTDGDGIDDADEILLVITDPNDIDTDGDGMPDGWEDSNSLDPLADDADGDPDADGITNLEEYELGLDPNDYDQDVDMDGLMNAVETNTGIYQGVDDTGTDQLEPDTDGGREWDGLEVLAGLDPNDSSDDRGWGTPDLIRSGDLGLIVIDQTQDGKIHAVWEEENVSNYYNKLYYSNYQSGTWSAPELLPGESVRELDLIADGNTLRIAYCHKNASGNYPIAYQERSSAGVWGATVNVVGNSSYDFGPRLAASDTELYAFFGINNGYTMGYNVMDLSSGDWGSTVQVMPHPIGFVYPEDYDVAITAGGTVHLVYQNIEPDYEEVYYTSLEAGTTNWGDPVWLSAPVAGSGSHYPKIKLDQDNNPIVIWHDYLSPDREVYIRRSRDGEWTSPLKLSSQANSHFFDFTLDSLGNFYAAISYQYTAESHFGVLGPIPYSESYNNRASQLIIDNDGETLHLLCVREVTNSLYWAYITSLSYPDTDGEGLNDLQEFIMGSDPALSDSDQDGLNDWDESEVYGTDFNNTDSDDDGISDGEEVSWGLDPASYDTDGGGEGDGLELYLGKDPLDPSDDYAHGPVVSVESRPDHHYHHVNVEVDDYGKISLFYDLYYSSGSTTYYEIWENHSLDGGSTWSESNSIYQLENEDVYMFDAKVLGASTAIMVLFGRDNEQDLYAGVYSEGTLDQVEIVDSGYNDIEYARLGVISADTVIAVWDAVESDSHPRMIYYAVWQSGTGWGTPQQLTTSDDNSHYPWIVTDNEGTAHLIYTSEYDPTGQARNFLYYRQWNGTGWDPPEAILTREEAILAYPVMWVSPGDIRHILVNESPVETSKWDLSYLKYEGSWSEAVQVSGDLYKESAFGLITMHIAESYPGIVHTFSNAHTDGVYKTYRISKFSQVWNKPIPFLDDLWIDDIVSDPSGEIHFVGSRRLDSGVYEVFYTDYWYPDSDYDGITDDGEYLNGTDKDNPDTDGDGLTDYEELITYGTDPTMTDTDGDGISDPLEVELGTNPASQDSDSDHLPDKWEVSTGLDPLADGNTADPDNDGLTNYEEFKYNTNPLIAEPVPSSSCDSPLYENGDTIPVTFTCDTYLADVDLYVSYDGSKYMNMDAYGYSKSCLASDLSFQFEPYWGDGEYRFFTRARLGDVLIEPWPASPPDSLTVLDTQDPAMVGVTDDGDYTSDTGVLNAYAEAEDLGPAGLDGYYYAVGTAAYDAAGWDDVLSWTLSSSGSTISHTFGSTVLSEGTTYYVTVKVTDNAGNESPLPFSSDGIIVDPSGPSAPVVTDDGDYSTSTEMLHATWDGASDAVSGIDHYKYSISTSTSGAPDVIDWTITGDTSMTEWGLSLSNGSTYYVGVKSVNGAGLVSSVAWSDGIMVDSDSPVITSSSPSHREIVFGELNNDDVVWLSGLTVDIGISDPASGVNGSSVAVVLDFDTVCNGDCSISGDTLSFVYDSDTLGRGNHVINLTAADQAGNFLFQNIIFVVEDPRKVIINPVWSEWEAGDADLTFTAAGGTGEYYWVSPAGTLDSTTASEVHLSPTASPGAYVVSVSDAKLVSAQATVVINGVVELAPAVVRLNPGDTVRFTASGGSAPYSWTATGGSCSMSRETTSCLFTAGTSEGEYSVSAQEAGGESFTSRVIISASVGRSIVVVGGGLVDENRQVDTLNAMGHFAYETLLARGFSKGQVKYLNPDATQLYDGDGDGFADDIDDEPTSSSLQNAIETWATTDGGPGDPAVGAGVPLIIYLIDHGSSSNFLVNYDDSGAPDLVSASDLDAWISSVESGTSVDVVVIYDACYSGAFLSTLGTGGPNRMVLTSSSSTESAYFGVNGTVSFSQFFWQHIRQSKTVLESFNSATSALASWSGQTPWLDDNGTGVYETAGGSKDGAWAAEFEIGADFSTGALLLELSACVEDFPLDSSTCYTSHLIEEGSSVVLYAQVDNVQHDEVGAVFAIISPPGYSPPDSADGSYETPWLVDENGNPLPRAYLEWDASQGHFSHTFTPEEINLIFDVNGRYAATLFSMDKSGQASASFDVNLTIFGPDPYEPDDGWTAGSDIVVDSTHAQAHNFHDSYDEDWVTFTVSGSTAKYHKIYTENLAENCDTVLELYGETLGSLTPLIISDDDSGSEYGASMIYKLLEPGTYHVLCRHYDGTVYGEFTEYDLRVDQEDLTTGTLEGYITDLETGYGLYGADVTLYVGGDNILETTTGTGGHYIFHNEVSAGEGYTLEASKANYLEGSIGCPPISIGGISRQDLALEPKSDTGVLAGYVYEGSTVLPDVSLYVGSKSTDSDGNGFYLFRLSPGSYSIWALQDGYDNYYAGGLSVVSGETTIHDIYMQAEDLDGDGLSDADEQEVSSCTLYDNPDTDGDGLCDGNTSVYDGSTLLCEAGEDMNLNGVVDDGETDPCEVDTDGDSTNDLDDCDPLDPNNWSSCATCLDGDTDTWYAGCDAYISINGPDCDDGNSVVYPGAPELCDGIDNQCPGDAGYGTVDEGCDLDGDGLSDSLEDSGCTDSLMADTDGDGLCDGNTSVYDGSTLLCSAGEDMDLDGVVDSSETDPCNADTDSGNVNFRVSAIK